MDSRERILIALSHREPDRVPYDLGALGPSGISIQAYRNLLKYLHADEKGEVGDTASQRAKLSENFLQRFRVDTRSFRVRPKGSWSLKMQEEGGYSFFYDEWGIGRKLAKDQGLHFFIFHQPLSEVETSDLPRFPWPDPLDPNRLAGVENEVLAVRKQANPAFVLGSPFSSGLLQFGAQLEGHERFFTDLVLDPRRTEWLLDKLLQLKLSFYQNVLDRMGEWIDIVGEMDDFGHQHSLWVSVEMFRKLIKPRYAELFSFIKKRYGKKILLHSDGAIHPLIPDIIEMGVEILNPIQVGAKDMGDTRKLKKEFGDSLTFWGGGVDIQHTLPFSTPQEVEDEVKRRIEDLAPGGGFVFAATQAIQPETPPENIMAMWKALQSYGIYRGNSN
ncbi:MAG: uroporphyrinogen decarboxylase family protein [Deltaproteobacteria bacterium]|nr:uroporphyrinogen decarboxylase family protein [Deltaproteobacteria bacterium]